MRMLVVASSYPAFEAWYEKNQQVRMTAHLWCITADFLRGVSTQDTRLVYTACARKHPQYAAIKAKAEQMGFS